MTTGDNALAARAALGIIDDHPSTWSRREFLRAVGWGVGGAALLHSLGARPAWATPLGANEGVLVVVGMYGGNDGFNTVVRHGEPSYGVYRGGLAIPASSVLPLGDGVGLHPNLAYLKQRWDAGEVAIVQGVGYPDPDFSHFTSMSIWMSGIRDGAPSSGWLGRWLDGRGDPLDALVAASIGSSVPLHLVGHSRRAVGVPPWGGGFGTGNDPNDLRLYEGLRAYAASTAGRGVWHDTVASTIKAQVEVARKTAPVFATPLPDGELRRKLTVAARLVNADLGLRVLEVSWGGFDTHEGQAWQHAALMTEFDEALRAFFETLDPAWHRRVTVMTFSEFGRTPYANGSAGTDHGTVGEHFVIGAQVRGGFHGDPPSISGLQRWDRAQHTVDFRSYYASVLDGWLGGGSTHVLGGSFATLPLFRAGPGAAVVTPPPPPPSPPPPLPVTPPPSAGVAGSCFVPLSPRRILDTRRGLGAPVGRIGTGAHIDVPVTGRGGIPGADVVAVVMNVTGTGALGASVLTCFGTGRTKPSTASLTVSPGHATANLVIAEVGPGGAIRMANDGAPTHCVGDVVGYFSRHQAAGLVAMSPRRLADTRRGLGLPAGRLGQGRIATLKVAGVSGVPTNAKAVVVNVTATGATHPTFVSLWPDGMLRPEVATLTTAPGRVTGNLAVVPVGSGGRIGIYHDRGEVHLVIDVLGCFTADGPGGYVPVRPERLLDTRRGLGTTVGKVASQRLTIRVAGRAGVPVAGAAAVLATLTVTGGTRPTFATVWPAGAAKPATSNVNAGAGETVSNTVLVPLGADGSLHLAHDAGDAHLVLDVQGWFTG